VNVGVTNRVAEVVDVPAAYRSSARSRKADALSSVLAGARERQAGRVCGGRRRRVSLARNLYLVLQLLELDVKIGSRSPMTTR